MIFSKNIAAFRSVRRSHGIGLIVRCYSQCVYLELCLKTDAALRNHSGNGHSLPSMLRQVRCVSVPTTRQLTSLISRLESRMRSLQQHTRNPTVVQALDAHNHPQLRYRCHSNDAVAPFPGSTDSELLDLLAILDQVILLLRSPNTSLPL